MNCVILSISCYTRCVTAVFIPSKLLVNSVNSKANCIVEREVRKLSCIYFHCLIKVLKDLKLPSYRVTFTMIRNMKLSTNVLKNTCQQFLRKYSDQPTRVEKTVNTVTLLGRVGNEPQKRGNEEHPVVTFSLATHNNYKYENGDWAQRTDWHRIVVFKPSLRDSVLNYLKKGQRTYISGKITYGEVVDQEGKTRLSTSIIADDIIFINSN